MADKITCLVTLHGVGFEQPPQATVANSGYADPLHQHLKRLLGQTLSDDPKRSRTRHGENGVIYVESRWRDSASGNVSSENGLKRLGSWDRAQTRVDVSDALLVDQRASTAHIALIYSNLEPARRHLISALTTLSRSLFSLSRYANLPGFTQKGLDVIKAVLRPPELHEEGQTRLRPRTDWNQQLVGFRSGLMGLEDDIAGYICDNDERERVRSFVAEALTRLAYRSDVENIIFNTHSNGTVIAFDILRHLPEAVTSKIKALITTGSPLRKYVDLFSWGNEIQTGYAFEPWYNFFDPRDPVGDQLNPPATWRIGQSIPLTDETLFNRLDFDNERAHWIKINDLGVNNVKWSTGSGLRAHNYWDNEAQFVPQLAEIVRAVVNRQPISLVEQLNNVLAPDSQHTLSSFRLETRKGC